MSEKEKPFQNSSNKIKLATKLHKVMSTYSINVLSLSEALGVNYKTVCSWQAGNTAPRAKVEYQRVMDLCDDLLAGIHDNKGVIPVIPHAKKQKSTKSALDVQVGGSHYKDMKIQPGYYSEINGLDFFEGDIVKRVSRHDKDTGKGAEDLRKVIHEAQLILEIKYGITE